MTQIQINWFEIPAENLDRAAAFYARALKTSLGEMETPAGPIRTFMNSEAPVGALVASPHNAASSTGALVYFGTDDIEATLDRVGAAGGTVVLPKTSIGAFGHIAQFLDSEGHRVALHTA